MLGVGDAAAAVVGRWVGKHKWPGSRRTLEGSLAFFLSSVGAVGWVGGTAGGWKDVGLACGLLSLLEAFTGQIDNLVLPVYAVALLNCAAVR